MKVNRKQLSEILEVSDRQIGHYLNEGMPADRPGKTGAQVTIRTGPAIRWLIERRADQKSKKRESERERLYREQADEKALSNARERGQLIYREHVGQAFMHIAQSLVGSLDGLAGRLANELAHRDARVIRASLLSAHRQVRRDLAFAARDFIMRHGGEDPFAGETSAGKGKARKKQPAGKKRAARAKASR